MKPWIKFLVLALSFCMLLSFSACNSDLAEETTSTETTETTETTVAPTEPDPMKLYDAACQAVNSQTNLVIHFDYSHERSINGQAYSEISTGDAYYKGLGTAELEALVSESLDFSGYETNYIRSYVAGAGYCRVDNHNYTCQMTADDFVAQQIPVILLDAGRYDAVTYSCSEDGTLTISFDSGNALEGWVENSDKAQLTKANGTVTLNTEEAMTGATYYAKYTIGNTEHTIQVSIIIEMPTFVNFSTYQPVYPDDCPSVSDLTIPRRMLQTVGDLYATDSITASYSDSLYSAAFAVVRTQTGNFDTWGRGEAFICAMDTQVMVTDYAGTSTVNSQSISYKNGLYSYATNGGEETVSDTVTAEDVRISCEDGILSSLFELGHIGSATMEDTGDFLRIKFTGNETFTKELCDSIYAMFSMDLDEYADSYETGAVGGYLYINKYTGLPTALGMNLERSHVIAGASYALTYQLDQAMELPSSSAYTNITGQPENPANAEETAAPLFYKVTGKNGKTLWLLGTIHAGDNRTGNLPDEIVSAFASSDALAVEFNTKAFEQSLTTDTSLINALTEAYYYGNDEKYSDHLSKSVRNQLKQLIYASGSNSANAPYMKVGIWNSLVENFYLQQSSNLSADLGMDMRLLSWAEDQKKPVYEIESGLSQIQLISGLSDDLQVMLLEDTLETGLLGYGQALESLYALWCQGDEEALTAYLQTDTSEMSKAEKALYKEYNKAMITNRNKVMHKAAVKYLKSGETVFYAVGLAHLLGEDGLVASLRDAGYTVELVTYE